jgi:putative salt-induced outer membrane protein YdiY
MFSSSRLSAAMVAALLFLPFGAMADRIVMKNGDVITGTVSRVTASEVFIKPGYAAEFAVSLADVDTLHMEKSLEVKLADEESSPVSGVIALDDAGQQVLVVDGEARPIRLEEIAGAAAPAPHFEWNASVDFNATVNNGNSDSRNSLLFTKGGMRMGNHRHTGDLTIRREEANNISTVEQDLFNYSYNWLFADPWYAGASLILERDPIRELDHRYTPGLLLGRDIFDETNRFLTFSLGVGYTDEEIAGTSESGAVGLWNLRYTQKFFDGMDFFHTQNFTRQLYGEDNTIFKTNTGFRFDIYDGLYASLSLRYDYETEPAAGASKDDSTLAMGVGYSF